MLSVKGVNQYYGESHILWDLGSGRTEGGCTCLMGRNGVGKTTLLKAIMGLIPTRSGAIEFAGSFFIADAGARAAARGYRLCAAGARDFPAVDGGGKPAGKPGRAWRRPKNHLFPVLKRRGGDLSGGQQQLASVGRWPWTPSC